MMQRFSHSRCFDCEITDSHCLQLFKDGASACSKRSNGATVFMTVIGCWIRHGFVFETRSLCFSCGVAGEVSEDLRSRESQRSEATRRWIELNGGIGV